MEFSHTLQVWQKHKLNGPDVELIAEGGKLEVRRWNATTYHIFDWVKEIELPGPESGGPALHYTFPLINDRTPFKTVLT